MERESYTVREASRALGLSVPTVIRMCEEGTLQHFVSPGGHRMWVSFRARTPVPAANGWDISAKQGNTLLRFLLVEASQAAARCNPDWRRRYLHLMMRREKGIAKRSVVLDVAQWLGLFADGRVRFARRKARNRTWREIARRPLDWASRSLQREFEVVIMVEVLIGEMSGKRVL